MDEQTMSFWDHLEVFRGSLVRIVIILLIFMVVCFLSMPYIYNPVILGPTHGDFFLYRWVPLFKDNFSCEIININVASQFMTHVTTSFWLALVLAFPVLMWELWKFISPALYKNESRPVGFAFLFGTGMFYLGCVIGYCLIFPFMFRFLTEYQLSEEITNQINLNSYMHSFLMMIFVMGVVFELPLLIWLLSKLGLIDKTFLRKYRRHAVVILMVLAAVITPSGDPFTLLLTFTPLYLLYELGIFLARPAAPKEEEDDDDDDDEDDKGDGSKPSIESKSSADEPKPALDTKPAASEHTTDQADASTPAPATPSEEGTADEATAEKDTTEESAEESTADATSEESSTNAYPEDATRTDESTEEPHKPSIPEVTVTNDPFFPDPPRSADEARAQAAALAAAWKAKAEANDAPSTDTPA